MLRHSGYRTVLSGKMHFIGADQLHGFEERVTTDIYPADFSWSACKFVNQPHTEQYIKWCFPDQVRRNYDKSIEYDEETLYEARKVLYNHDESRPLFLTVSFTHPHNPYCAPEKYLDFYRNAKIPMPNEDDCRFEHLDEYNRYLRLLWNGHEEPFSEERVRNARLAYYAMMTCVDEKIGSLIDTLRECGLYENTIIIFTSDHGDMLGCKGMWDKRTFFENSLRVPLLAAGPGIKKQRIQTAVSLVDIFPTFIDLTESDWSRSELEGKSLANGLSGGSLEEKALVAEYYNERVPYPFRSAVLGRKKYVHFPLAPTRDMLFDCAEDALERNNCINDSSYAKDISLLLNAVTVGYDATNVTREAQKSLCERNLILNALGENKVDWNYTPLYNADTRYIR
jgi:choline-sulfatase